MAGSRTCNEVGAKRGGGGITLHIHVSKQAGRWPKLCPLTNPPTWQRPARPLRCFSEARLIQVDCGGWEGVGGRGSSEAVEVARCEAAK